MQLLTEQPFSSYKLSKFQYGITINLYLLRIYHTVRIQYMQLHRTRPYVQIHSLITKILKQQNNSHQVNFGLLSVGDLALQSINLARCMYILETNRIKGWRWMQKCHQVVCDSFIPNRSALVHQSAAIPGWYSLSAKHRRGAHIQLRANDALP